MIESKGTIIFAVVGVHELYHTRRGFFNGMPCADCGHAGLREHLRGWCAALGGKSFFPLIINIVTASSH
jgi:hypothetical protein